MADIINLNRHRKARARVDKRADAAENRARHGTTSVERAAAQLEDRRTRESLDGKQLDPEAPQK